jgi:hypothetical protein
MYLFYFEIIFSQGAQGKLSSECRFGAAGCFVTSETTGTCFDPYIVILIPVLKAIS